MSKLKIGIIIGTTREGRFGDRPAAWIHEIAAKRDDLDVERIDLRDYPLPFFDEPRSPAWSPPRNEVAQRWGKKMSELDGYIITAAEYNHGPSGVLKNALDHAYNEYNKKPVAFVGYGGVGAARAIEQLRLIAIALQLAPIHTSVHIGMAEYMGLLRQGKAFEDYPHLGSTAATLLDELTWWTRALKTARELR